MFLGINEMRYSKLRYSLVIGTLFLISYVVFFLTGLAFGLASQNRTAVDKWNADTILLHEDAEGQLSLSQLNEETVQSIEADETAILLQSSGILRNDTDESFEVSYFGIDSDEFIMPEVVEGSNFDDTHEIIVDSTLKEEYDAEIGDILTSTNEDIDLTIVGFTENAQFSVSPVIYLDTETYEEVSLSGRSEAYNAVITQGELTEYPDEVEAFPISDFINNLPGYNAQVLTFSFMIGSLVIISAIVIGIFIYILTMQKVQIFGVLKAQGVSSNYISQSVIFQSFFLSLVGILLGLLASYLTTLVLPVAVPYENSPLFLLSISLLILIVSTLSGLFSVRTIVKIDPLRAIS